MGAEQPRTAKDIIKGAKRQRREHRINLAGDLVAQIQHLEVELQACLEAERGAPARLASKPASLAKAEEIEALRGQMAESWLTLVLEQKARHEWRDFKAANPPRDGEPTDQSSQVNFDSLVTEFMPTCVVEPDLDAADWKGIFEVAAPGDLDNLGLVVFSMHEQRVDIPLSPRALAAIRKSEDDSRPQRISE